MRGEDALSQEHVDAAALVSQHSCERQGRFPVRVLHVQEGAARPLVRGKHRLHYECVHLLGNEREQFVLGRGPHRGLVFKGVHAVP